MRLLKSMTLAIVLTAFHGFAHASDHIDGHEVQSDRRADLTDLYSWTTAPGRIAMVLTSGPLTRKWARPQENLTLSLRLRRLSKDGIAASEEYRLDCTGTRGKGRTDSLECTHPSGSLSVPWGAEASHGDLRIFAGIRRDPFFIALGKVHTAHPRDGERRARRGVDFLHNWVVKGKVAALIVEMDAESIPGTGPLIGVVGEDARADDRIDRIGRAELGNFVMADRFGKKKFGREDVRGAWNHEDAFALTPGHIEHYREAIDDGMVRLDHFDDGEDWPSPHPLRDTLLDDWLTLDPAIACTVDSRSFLEIEAARLASTPHVTCGGRTPNDDAVDRLLTWAINGPKRVAPSAPLHGTPGVHAPPRGDGIDRPGAPAVDVFPFLREP